MLFIPKQTLSIYPSPLSMHHLKTLEQLAQALLPPHMLADRVSSNVIMAKVIWKVDLGGGTRDIEKHSLLISVPHFSSLAEKKISKQ